MKAIVYTKYGQPEELQLKEVDKLTPGDHEVLVKIHAASVNSWDWDLLRGKPRLYRLIFGLLKPKFNVLGCDIAGTVSEIGRKVIKFQPGDEVLGDISNGRWGGFAEYARAREDELVKKPADMTFEQAAALPQAGVLALQGLRDKRQLQPGEEVLINGAGGGVGTFAIQIAKYLGAEVTAVDRGDKLDMLKSTGADHVVDYQIEDFTRTGKQYDLIIDVVAHKSVFDYRRALKPGGTFVMIGGSASRMLQLLFLGSWISRTSGKKLSILPHKANKDLDYLIGLHKAGKVVPVIDRIFPLEEVPDALRHLGDGNALGKVIITLAKD